MRLDHLLSREPSFVGNKQGGLLGCLFVFLCLHVFTAQCGWWVWVRLWVGHKKFESGQAHCRVHVQHRVSVCCPCGWWLPTQPADDVVLLVWVVCGGLFVICIVVASIFVLYCFLCFV